jgi:hypothetical protein
MLCADLVEVEWSEEGRPWRRRIGNLEDISLSGACLQFDVPVPLGTPVKIYCSNRLLSGEVRYCVFREVGYFIGVEFDEGCQWSRRIFRPRHMLDPRKLIARAASRLGVQAR